MANIIPQSHLTQWNPVSVSLLDLRKSLMIFSNWQEMLAGIVNKDMK